MTTESSPTTDHPTAEPGGGAARWRVMVVRIPPDAVEDVRATLPVPRTLSPEELPFIARITSDANVASRTAHRLRAAGAVVLLLQEPGGVEGGAFCAEHPDRIAARDCVYCDAPICTACRTSAGGEDICASCRAKGRGRRRRVRVRQLFVLFLFAVFCYEVFERVESEQLAVAPGQRVRVAVLQFYDPTGPVPAAARMLNSVDAGHTTLEDLGPWLSSEQRRYGGAGDYDVEVMGPWGRAVSPPALTAPGEGPLRAAWRAFQYPRYFHGLATDQGVDPSDYGARLYVVYRDQGGDRASESMGSEQGRVGIAFVSARETNPAYAVLTVAHELGHILGAGDLYDPETFRAQHPEGFVEPYAEPLFPQEFAELMAVDRPLSRDLEAEVQTLEEVRVGHRTAADFGWIRPEQADVFYAPPALSAQERLRPQAEEEPDQSGHSVLESRKDEVPEADASGRPAVEEGDP